jgi:hypothetical protein
VEAAPAGRHGVRGGEGLPGPLGHHGKHVRAVAHTLGRPPGRHGLAGLGHVQVDHHETGRAASDTHPVRGVLPGAGDATGSTVDSYGPPRPPLTS